MTTRKEAIKQLREHQEANKATPMTDEELKGYTVPQLVSLIGTYTQNTETEPTQPTNTSEQPTAIPKDIMTFGDTIINTETGETTQLQVTTETIDVSDKIGYIQAQGANRVGFPTEIKAIHKALYFHPTNLKHQQLHLAKGLQYHLEILGCNLTNKYDSESVENFSMDTEWITWFKTQGAALIGQFARFARDPDFIKLYNKFIESKK